jgi:ABC-type dipeptide/oligopeptide/nickel transport system permease subunit
LSMSMSPGVSPDTIMGIERVLCVCIWSIMVNTYTHNHTGVIIMIATLFLGMFIFYMAVLTYFQD